MTAAPARSRIPRLAWVYGAFCVPGAIVPWYFNLRHSFEQGALLTIPDWFRAGFVSTLTGSITTDFLIGTTPVLIWMVAEARRLKMRNLPLYVVSTFLVALAFSCPLFLMMREIRIQRLADEARLA